jgi:hypothetical protein
MRETHDGIVALIGEEGAGKTWLTTLAWQSLDDPPFFLLCTTDNPAWEIALRAPLEFLARLLTDQTGGAGVHDAQQRWLRRLNNWAGRESSEPRIWLVLDGLNERESRPWTAVIDALMALPAGLGVRLLLTSRPAFFSSRVLPRLAGYSVRELKIEPFTEQEVLDALRRRGIEQTAVPVSVREFLRNPRVFSIAIGMLDRIKPDELTRERLLFEYWRKRFEERRDLQHNDGDIRRLLISHAQSIRSNLGAPSRAVASFRRDLWKEHSGPARRILNPTIDDELTEIESGRFFEPDPDLDGNYRIRADGLAYALGLLVVDDLRGVPEAEMLTSIQAAIDPIRGLDLMAEVVLAAVGISCIDPQCPDALAAALIHSLLDVQNLDDAHIDAPLAYVPSRPGAFIAAAELLWSDIQGHADRKRALGWLLRERRDHESVRGLLDDAIRRWFALWCSEPDQLPQHVHSGRDAERATVRHNERHARTADLVAELSAEERSFFEECCHRVDEPALMSIDSLALELIAGRPLAPFAKAIVAWQLCDTIAGRIYSSSGVDRELDWALRLNPIDLDATAHTLREALSRFEAAASSTGGLWTAIRTLRSTGLAQDTARADELYRRLPPGEVLRGWRRIESFCDTDPIDPRSSMPTNLAKAVEDITAIEPEKVRASVGQSREDHDLAELTPALARFAPEVLFEKVRAVARNMGARTDHAARFLAFLLPKFSALLGAEEINSLREALRTFSATGDSADQHVGAQYLLMTLLPHLTADEQLQALLALPEDRGEILLLVRFFKPLEPDELAKQLERAERSNVVEDLRRTLFFSSSGKTALTQNSRIVLERCFSHTNHVVRLLAFETAAECEDEELICALAKSDWSGASDCAESTQSFYGSKALARVPDRFRGVDMLMRMSLGWQTAVTDAWGEDCVRRHAEILIQLIRNSLDRAGDVTSEIRAQRNILTVDAPATYPYLDMTSESVKEEVSFEKLSQMQDDEAWKAEQRRKKEVINSYIAGLEERSIGRLVDPVYLDGFKAMARHAPDAFQEIVSLLEMASDRQLQPLASIAACAANVLSQTDSERAGQLFERLFDVTPDVNLNIGPAEMPFNRLALWTAEDGTRIQKLRVRRLQSATNDADLFIEVLCAAQGDKTTEVLAYARQLMTTGHPGQIARALMIAGFCDANETSPQLFNDPRLDLGFLAQVRAAAQAAYDRNIWAGHWYRLACAATDPAEYWRYCALMIRAADGRFVLWFDPEHDLADQALLPFAYFARDSLKDRSKDKSKDRGEKLFGARPPSKETLSEVIKITDRAIHLRMQTSFSADVPDSVMPSL